MSEQIEVIDMDDEAFEAHIAELDAKIEDNEANDGDVDEFKALLEKKSEVSKQRDDAKKDRDTRQQSHRDDLKQVAAEATTLEAKLAAGLAPDDEADVLARLAFVEDRRATLETGLPFAGISTGKLEGDLEAVELQREVLWSELRAAEDNKGSRPAHYRKVKGDYEALAEKQATLRTELQSRELQEMNKVLGRQAAERHAERMLRAEDAQAVNEADEGRKETKREDLAESYAARLSLRIPIVEQQLWRKAEENVAHALVSPSGGVEPGYAGKNQKIRNDEKKIEERIEHEHQRRRLIPRGWTFPTKGESQ
jgi:hypothetical protein